jgi:hypothetical protein
MTANKRTLASALATITLLTTAQAFQPASPVRAHAPPTRSKSIQVWWVLQQFEIEMFWFRSNPQPQVFQTLDIHTVHCSYIPPLTITTLLLLLRLSEIGSGGEHVLVLIPPGPLKLLGVKLSWGLSQGEANYRLFDTHLLMEGLTYYFISYL